MIPMAELEAIVEEAVDALARLEAEELEALEGRLLALVRAGGVRGHGMQEGGGLELRSKLELLGRCVAMTAGNLIVLERLAERGAVA